LKHVAAHEIGYATNGVFIAAAIAAGFEVCPASLGSLNAVFKICTEAWKQQLPMQDHERLAAALSRAQKAMEEAQAILLAQRGDFWTHNNRVSRIASALFGLRNGLSEPKGQSARRLVIHDLYFARELRSLGVTVGDAAREPGRP
jgi:hypothetical protein